MGVVGNLFRKMTLPDFAVFKKLYLIFRNNLVKIRKGNQ